MLGRAWANGTLLAPAPAADGALADARAMGLSVEDMAAVAAAIGAGDEARPACWPDHGPALQAFLVAATQWRVVGAGSMLLWLGLDYAGAAVAWASAGLSLTVDQFDHLRLIELGAREALNGGAR